MRKITASILVSLLLFTLSLGIYVIILKDPIDKQTSRIDDLGLELNESKTVMKSSSDRNMYYADVLKRLEDGHNLTSTLVQITKNDNGYRLDKIE